MTMNTEAKGGRKVAKWDKRKHNCSNTLVIYLGYFYNVLLCFVLYSLKQYSLSINNYLQLKVVFRKILWGFLFCNEFHVKPPQTRFVSYLVCVLRSWYLFWNMFASGLKKNGKIIEVRFIRQQDACLNNFSSRVYLMRRKP